MVMKKNYLEHRKKAERNVDRSELTLADIVDIIAPQTGLSQRTVEYAAIMVFRTIRQQMMEGRSVVVPEFGNFGFVRFNARTRADISKGNKLSYTPAHTRLKFVPDAKWQTWQKMSSMERPEGGLPEGVQYGYREEKHSLSRKALGIDIPRTEVRNQDVDFWNNTVLRGALNRERVLAWEPRIPHPDPKLTASSMEWIERVEAEEDRKRRERLLADAEEWEKEWFWGGGEGSS